MIGIDVGGANLKVADSEGVHIQYCPLWSSAPIKKYLGKFKGQDAAVVMSGELADCFTSKQEGIRWIVQNVQEVFPDALFYGIDGQFHREPVPALAAANWLVAAQYLLPCYKKAVLVDIGSTTTDIIPLLDLSSLLGMTDLHRLQKGYLVYNGFLRTSIPSFVRSLTVNGRKTPLSAEFFAIAADVHLLLGHITVQEYSCETPDKKPPDHVGACHRLARLVCSDPFEVGGEEGVKRMAEEIWTCQKELIQYAIRKVCDVTGYQKVLWAGVGGRLFYSFLGGTDLHEVLGQAADALPSFAVREVALRNAGC